MKRRIASFTGLTFVVMVLALMSSDSTAEAQRRMRWYESGLVELPSTQMLCITAISESSEPIEVEFRKMEYMDMCSNDGPCKHTMVSNEAVGTLTLNPGEGGSVEFLPNGNGVRGVIRSSGPVLMLNHVVDMSSGSIAAAYDGSQWTVR